MSNESWLKGNFANFVWFQSLWFTCVLGATYPIVWSISVALVLAYTWMVSSDITRQKFIAIAVTVVLGIGLENLWLQLDFLTYLGPQVMPLDVVFPPFWIVFLWFGLAMSFLYSLKWMQGKPVLAALLSFIACPISYYSAERLGAVSVNMSFEVMLVSIALSWALVIPLLIELTRYLDFAEEGLEKEVVKSEY